MAMFGYDVYIMLHLAGAFAVAMAYGGLGMWAMNEKEMGENRFKKLGVIAHGAGLLAIIVGGFGMLANMGENPMTLSWVHLKLTIWLALGGGLTLLKKKPELAKEILGTAFMLMFAAASIGANHRAWFGV
jgi:uncharacterized membrane protein